MKEEKIENGGGICRLVTHSSLVRLLAAMDAVQKFFFLCLYLLFSFRSTHRDREKEYLGVIPQYLTALPYSLHCSRALDSGCISYSEWLRYIQYISISFSISLYVYTRIRDVYTECMYVCTTVCWTVYSRGTSTLLHICASLTLLFCEGREREMLDA
jgi:hypothetical protein